MKKSLILLVIILLLTSCDNTTPTADIIITDFEEVIVVRLDEGNENEVLVPYDCAMAVGDVEAIEFHYSVALSKKIQNEGILNILITDILIDNNNQYSHLVEVYVLGEEGGTQTSIFNDEIIIIFVVKLLEPIDMEEAIEKGLDLELVNVEDSNQTCEDIKGKTITFNIEFEVIQQEVVD